ncbi:hypothetical protein [Escherichia coli]
MAKVDQTKASRLLSATKTMSLGANKIQSEYFMAIMLQKILISGPNLNNTLKKAFVGGVVARITAERFLLLLMSL